HNFIPPIAQTPNSGVCIIILYFTTKNYLACMNALVVSSMRNEKAHSLSYHDNTLAVLPITLVWLDSKIEEAGFFLKSTETNGKSLYARIPLSAPSEASFKMLLISLTLVSRAAKKVKS